MVKMKQLFGMVQILLLMSATYPVLASNLVPYPTIEGTSYDYSQNLAWGFGGIRSIYYTEEGEEIIEPFDTDYVGLSVEKKQEIQNNPDGWSKGWIRLNVLPNLRYAKRSREQRKEIRIESGIEFGDQFTPESLMEFSSFFILNVRIVNCDELGIYPKETVVFSGNPDLPDEEKQKASAQADNWYMEVLIENRGRSEVDLDEAIKKAAAIADIGVYTDSFRWFNDYSISLTNCGREVRFQDNGIAFYAEEYRESSLEDIHFGAGWSQKSLPYEVVQDVILSPKKYRMIELGLYMAKEMEWGVCIISPMSTNLQNTWFFFNCEDGYPLSYNDQWENGERIMIPGFFVLIRDDGNEKLDIETHLKSLHLQLEFSTEAAGQMYWDGGSDGWWGYAGMRFSKKIDMAMIKPVNEDSEEQYPWVSVPIYY